MESDQTSPLVTPENITDFEACIQKAREAGPQQLAFAERLIPIAESETNPVDKEHRLREAHYHVAKLEGPKQVSSAQTLLELTKPGAIQNPEAQKHWDFEGPYCAALVERLNPAKRVELAARAAQGAANDWQRNASKDFRQSHSGLPLKALGKLPSERAKEGIMKALTVVKNAASKSICRSER
jgi:hypothetical protein